LGFGFARTFPQAIFFRTLGGALNGNIGVMRTMVSEIVQEKKSIYQVLDFLTLLTSHFRYQSRAFLLFPMCFNIGVIIGPILGGLLADPAGSYPKIFGHNKFLQKFPYAPPNILSAFFLFSAALGVFFGLSEVRSPPGHLMRIY
jgi:MFS family permease